MPTKLSSEILTAAIEGFEAQKQRLNARIAELRQMMTGGGAAGPGATEGTPAPRRRLSAAARRRIAAAQRKRWAAVRKRAGVASSPSPAAKKKSRLSPEGRRKIIEATKKRWAQVRAQKATTRAKSRRKKAPAKKAAVKTERKAIAKKVQPAVKTAEAPVL
jgi:hypothetical protein